MTKILLFIYTLAWVAAFPLLKRLPRIRTGWRQRTLQDLPEGTFDIWIQAASGGEAMLTNTLLDQLAAVVPQQARLKILATSGTEQGVQTLDKARHDRGHGTAGSQGIIDVTVSYFPLDAPHLMRKAFQAFQPRLGILMETELWPGYLVAAAGQNVELFLVNGRMSEKSFRSYRRMRFFFNRFGPGRILAVSRTDADRFAHVMGNSKVALMNNIKFDRTVPAAGTAGRASRLIFAEKAAPFIIFGSVRREEEPKILAAVAEILDRRKDIVVGIFPKHLERVSHWVNMLDAEHIATARRSEITSISGSQSVIVWDKYGELSSAYGYSDSAFVGGSLEKLGGQNFLEPLAFGLRPVIGPHWQNFSWVGREIVTSGLVTVVDNAADLAHALISHADSRQPREEVIEQVQAYLETKKGGTLKACQEIAKHFHFTRTE
ncbi:3-deoxy-D-manno-octulosonic acid transferase [Desulforhopalus singaporensis]|uniref:3-deoxy-D-manno-octulosonic acid transferase n=1 Tax=Desulforhopalus singaporensis TaxID=91360 RepID=A0A1H0RL00_9BACT|nr:glycosyltransferase N-terminal domain-containing protein [Desulforhopalus singaporensis]SDP29618.1 3-deoxy-D-manno-octulosonic-acid transferase [Desulforhopalus singaporensis]